MFSAKNGTHSHVANTTILSTAESEHSPDAGQTVGSADPSEVDNALEALSDRLRATLSLLHHANDDRVLATVRLMGLGSRTSLTAVGAISAPTDAPGAPIELLPRMRLLLNRLEPVRRSQAELDAERAGLEEFIASGPLDTPASAAAQADSDLWPCEAQTAHNRSARNADTHEHANGRHRHHPDGMPA